MLALYLNIKNKRLEHGWTQSQLAEKMGYADKSMIAKIERGKIDLPQSKIAAFAKVLGTTPSDLMGWDEDKDGPIIKHFVPTEAKNAVPNTLIIDKAVNDAIDKSDNKRKKLITDVLKEDDETIDRLLKYYELILKAEKIMQ